VYGVIYANARPDVPTWLPDRYASLVRACWSPEASDRPTFSGILRELRDMLREALAEGAEAAARAAAGVVAGAASEGARGAAAAAAAAAAEAAEAGAPVPPSLRQLYRQESQETAASALATRDSGATSVGGAESAPPG